MILRKDLEKFLNNPYSLENIQGLGHYLECINLGMLYLEADELLRQCDSEAIIRSYANALSLSTRINSLRIPLERVFSMASNPNKEIIIDQLNLINDYERGKIKLEEKLYLYPLYKGVIKHNMKYFIDALAEYPNSLDNHIVSMEIGIYVDYLDKCKRGSLSLYRLLVKYNLNNRFKAEILKLYNLLPEDTRSRAISYSPNIVIDSLSIDELINNIGRIENNDECYIRLMDMILKLNNNKAIYYFMKLLFKIKSLNSFNNYSFINSLRDKFIKCELLDLYIDNLSKSICVYYSEGIDNNNISLENYDAFFKIEAHASSSYDANSPVLVKKYRVLDIADNELISFMIAGGVRERYRYVNLIDKPYNSSALESIVDYADNNLYDFQAEIKEAQNEISIISASQTDKLLLEAFAEIENVNLAMATNTLSDEMKVGIEYYFDSINDEILLGFRIGNTKTYSVQRPNAFLDNFITEERYKYGKDLTFTHKLENLNIEDREPISFLRGLHPSYLKKNLRLDAASAIHLFKMLKGREIYYRDAPYALRLDIIRPSFKIDSKYKISFNMNNNKIIPLGSTYLSIDSKSHFIDLIDSRDKGLTDFVIKFKNESLERVKIDFINRIYPLYSTLIEVDPEIKGEFKSSELEIDSYFDFDAGGRICVRVSYIKDGDIINRKDLSTSIDRIKAMRFNELLEGFGFNKYDVIEDEAAILNFLKADLSRLKEYSNVYLSESIINKQILRFQPPTLHLSYNSDMLGVFLEKSSYSNEELYQILQAIRKKKKYILLKNDRIIDLDNKDADGFLSTVDDLDLDAKGLNEKSYKPLYQTLLAFRHLDNVNMDSYLVKLVDDIKGFKMHDITLPKLNASLRDYQIEAFKWLKILSGYHLGGILADDMGLGKTLEIITLLSSDESPMPSLIVTPKSLIFNWISEFNRFSPDYEIVPIYGSLAQREGLIKKINSNKRVAYITSYDSLRNDSSLYDMKFNYLILDEAQYIKNALALTSKAVKRIDGINKFALTGTPIENDIFDLWSIFDFLMPSYLPSLEKFKKSGNDSEFQEIIKNRVAPFILRRTKEAVLSELPEKFTRVISADMMPEQKKLYDAHCLNAREILKSSGSSFDVIHLLTRLRQICVDPRTFIGDFNEKGGKILLLRDMLPLYIKDGHRILIFSQFVKALSLIEAELKQMGIKYLILTGDTKAEDRVRLVNEFNQDEDIKVFLISLKAGGNGLNLVGADTVIHMDPWWNLASENQATDRAYRMGQKRNVEVIRLIVSDSIEQKVVELQYKKKDLIDRLISNDTSSIERISLDDLRFILE